MITPPLIAGAGVALVTRFALHKSWKAALVTGAITGAVALYLHQAYAAGTVAPAQPESTSDAPRVYDLSDALL